MAAFSWGDFLQRVFQFDAERGGNQFRQAVHFAVRNIHGAADVFHRGFRGHGAKRDDLRDIFAPVFLRDVLDQLAAPAHAEVDIDIGHGNAFGIQEALKEQVVLQRIHVRDAQRVADQAAGSRAAARADGNFLRARVVNEIPDDQEVALIAHLLDHFDLERQAALVFRQWMAQRALLRQRSRDAAHVARILRGPRCSK